MYGLRFFFLVRDYASRGLGLSGLDEKPSILWFLGFRGS